MRPAALVPPICASCGRIQHSTPLRMRSIMPESSKIPVVAGHNGSVLQPIRLSIVPNLYRFRKSMQLAVIRLSPKPCRSAPGRVQSGITSRHLVADDMSLLIARGSQPHFSALFRRSGFTARKNRAIHMFYIEYVHWSAGLLRDQGGVRRL